MKIKELISSIKFKAIESYVLLEKIVFPECENLQKNICINLIIVIDEQGIDGMENILATLAKTKLKANNNITILKDSLNRFLIKENKPFFFDNIEIKTASEFQNQIKGDINNEL